MAVESREVGPANGSTALVVQDYGVQSVVSIGQALERNRQLQEFVQKVMVKGEDYGVIPGTGGKPTLLKPGAEKLCEMYGLVPTYEVIESIKDWQNGFFYYEIKCALISKASGGVVAEGVGSCNSREKRYRNQDVYSIANTILKMGKKRAHVDASLSATRSSGLFTQDLEDDDAEETARHAQAARAKAEPPPKPAEPPKELDRARAELEYRALTEKADGVGEPAESWNPAWNNLEVAQKYRELRTRVRLKEKAEAERKDAEPGALFADGAS